MALLCRLKQPHLKNLSNQLKRCFFQPLLIPPHSRISTVTQKDSILHNTHFKIFQNTRSFAVPAQFKQKQEQKEEEEDNGPRLNEKITAPSVRLVLDTGHTVVSRREALERAQSRRLDLVEVDRNAKPPVCKIMDYHREKYVKELKEKERAKSKSEVTLRHGASKSVQFEGKIEEKDLQMKAATVKRMMESGYRVKCLAKMNDKKANDKTANDKKGNDKKGNDKKANDKKGNDKKSNDKKGNDKKSNDKKVDEKEVNDKLESDKKAIAIEYENLRKLLARFCTLIEDVAVVESGPEMEKKGAYVVVRHAKYGLPKKGTKKTSQLKATSKLVDEDSSSEADINPGNESPLLDDRTPTSHPPEASLNIESRYTEDPRSRAPPTEMNVASPQPAMVNRYIKDLRNRSSPAETNSPRRLQPQPPYQGRQPQQYPNQGRQPPHYPNQGRQPPQYPYQGRQPPQYPYQGRQPQQYPNQGSPTQVDPRNLTQSREVGQGQFNKNSRFPAEEFPRQEVSYSGALPNSSGQKYGVSNGLKPNSTTEPQPTVVNRYKQALNQNSTVPNFHGSRGQGR